MIYASLLWTNETTNTCCVGVVSKHEQNGIFAWQKRETFGHLIVFMLHIFVVSGWELCCAAFKAMLQYGTQMSSQSFSFYRRKTWCFDILSHIEYIWPASHYTHQRRHVKWPICYAHRCWFHDIRLKCHIICLRVWTGNAREYSPLLRIRIRIHTPEQVLSSSRLVNSHS